MVTGAGLRALGRLPSLRELYMAGICALSVEHLHVRLSLSLSLCLLPRQSCSSSHFKICVSSISQSHSHCTATNQPQFLPPSVEVLDMSDCRGPITKQLTLEWPRDRHPVALPWPPGLRALKLCGYGFFFAHLYSAHLHHHLHQPWLGLWCVCVCREAERLVELMFSLFFSHFEPIQQLTSMMVVMAGTRNAGHAGEPGREQLLRALLPGGL